MHHRSNAAGRSPRTATPHRPGRCARTLILHSFVTARRAAIFIHTGLHPDYHTERDRPDTLNYAKMARIVRMVHQLSWNLAQNSGRPIYSGP